MSNIIDSNPLVASGEYERVFVAELNEHDVLASGDVVAERTQSGNRHKVTMEDGAAYSYKSGATTVLIKARQP